MLKLNINKKQVTTTRHIHKLWITTVSKLSITVLDNRILRTNRLPITNKNHKD